MEIVSFFPGRIRVCSEVFKNADVLAEVRAFLEAMDGIEDFSANARTGSVAVVYDASVITVEMLMEAKETLEQMERDALAS